MGCRARGRERRPRTTSYTTRSRTRRRRTSRPASMCSQVFSLVESIMTAARPHALHCGMSKSTATRGLGFWMCLALVIGNMIGSGFFLLPATLAPFGWNGVAGWIVTTAGALCLAFVFASLARAYPQAGGPYAFSRLAFGPFAAFVVAWSYWVSMWVGNVAIATGVVAPLATLAPGITPYSAVITLALVWTLTAINCFGAKTVGKIQLITTILKFLPLAAVVVLAI